MTKTFFLTKRHYTNKDLILDHFGRLYHLPLQLVQNGLDVEVICANYRSRQEEAFSCSGFKFHSIPFSLSNSMVFLLKSWKYIYKFNPMLSYQRGFTFRPYRIIIFKIFKNSLLYTIYMMIIQLLEAISCHS